MLYDCVSCVSFSKIQFSKSWACLGSFEIIVQRILLMIRIRKTNTFPKRSWWEKSSRKSNTFIIYVWNEKSRRFRSYSFHGLIIFVCKMSYMQWPICHFDWRTLNNRPRCERNAFSRSLKSIWYVLYSHLFSQFHSLWIHLHVSVELQNFFFEIATANKMLNILIFSLRWLQIIAFSVSWCSVRSVFQKHSCGFCKYLRFIPLFLPLLALTQNGVWNAFCAAKYGIKVLTVVGSCAIVLRHKAVHNEN